MPDDGARQTLGRRSPRAEWERFTFSNHELASRLER
jgi:hypothetical protein